MSEQIENEAVDSAPAQENNAPEKQSTADRISGVDRQGNEKPAGYDPVDLSDLPVEKQQKLNERIDYLYGQVKSNERSLKEYKSIAAEQAKYIDDLMNGVGKVVDHLEEKTNKETESSIQQKMKSAFESGDMDGFLAEQSKLIELQSKKYQPKQQPQQKQQTQQQQFDDGDGLSPEDQRIVSAWEKETDQNGQPLRPWAVNHGSEEDPDPEYVRTILIAKKIADQNPGMPVRDLLVEIDKKMGVTPKNQGAGQTVMGGSLRTQGKSGTIKLSPQQERIAIRGKLAGPKASDADHIKAYRDQLQKIRNVKGA